MQLLIQIKNKFKNMTTAQSLKSQKGQALSLSKGFTLIELLVVIGILAILLAIVLIAINPARQFAQANNTKRNSDVQAILNAIHQYSADNGGNLPPGLSTAAADTPIAISYAGVGPTFCTSLVNLYIAALARDPNVANGANISTADCSVAGWDTGYIASRSAQNGRVTITAPNTQIPPATAIIELTR